MMDMATEWAATRKQFGKPIGQFQATGFRLADMAIGLRTADLLVADAVRRADEAGWKIAMRLWSKSIVQNC
jgi:alkylation response protein AidB-like acyl-CoA dehydrogenase